MASGARPRHAGADPERRAAEPRPGAAELRLQVAELRPQTGKRSRTLIDWGEIRARFPAVERCTYLNTAAGAPLSVAAAAAGRGYYESSLQDGDVHWDEWLERVENVRARAAGFLGVSSREVAFVSNASVGLNLAATMLSGRGAVIAVRDEFPSATLPWLQLGGEVSFVEPGPLGGASVESLRAALTPQAGVLVVGLVHYRSGYRYDLDELGNFCREHGLALVVDATQGLGALSVDLDATPVDFLVSSSYKWMTAGYGVALLVVNRRHLDPAGFPAAGWRSARDPYALIADRLDLDDSASALELGHPPFAGVFSLGAALEMFAELGTDAVEQRVLGLSGYLAGRLEEAGFETPARPQKHRSGIIHVRVSDPSSCKQVLAEHGVLVSARGNGIRISAHCYNNRADIDRLIDVLAPCPHP